MFGLIRKTFKGYAAPTKVRPEWTVPYLVYQAGIPRSRDMSLTGGGQIYGREFQGTFTPFVVPNVSRIGSLTGGGQMPSLPPALQALLGGQHGQGS